MSFLWFVSALAALIVLAVWRWRDGRGVKTAWQDLAQRVGAPAGVFDPAKIEGLPEPARRFFLFTLARGAPLPAAVEIEMRGEIGFGDKESPKYTPMKASEILAPPHGLVWRLRAGAISGSDGATPATSWTRFWVLGLIPVVRAGGDTDHRRSAFGRVVAEGAFWAPASLLPGPHVQWEPIDADRARAHVTYAGLAQAVDIRVAADGRPTQVVIQRWSKENADRIYRTQSFGGYLSEFREFEGNRLPTRVEGGNLIGTEHYFPFFKARVTDLRILGAAPPPEALADQQAD
jgi:hypothetical protein